MRRSRVPVFALGILAILALAFVFLLPSAPPEAVARAFRFIEALQAGRIGDAYSLTDHGADVGKNFQVFAANEDVAFLKSTRHPVTLEWASPRQSPAQCIARLLRGRRADPEILYTNFYVGAPFLVRLRHERDGWTVTYFEVHAE